MTILSSAADLVAMSGIGAVALALLVTMRFASVRPARAVALPPVTVLKPLCGNEPELEAALASICDQDYPDFQIVFGVRDPADPALAVIASIQARFPGHDITTVIDSTVRGANRKIANLLNMLPAARHDVLVCSDSDLHVAPDYLASIVAALDQPGTGLVTTVCTGKAIHRRLAASLGATAISHSFLPSVLLSRALGRADCLGTTMAIRRDILGRAGGLDALVAHVGDDNVLGRRVRRLGLTVALARTIPATAVPETDLRALWAHELRWARTIRALEPVLFGTSIVQYPIFWALIGLTAGTVTSVFVFAAAWVVRATAAFSISRALGIRPPPAWLLPARDLMSAAIVFASYLGASVVWRGEVMRVRGYPAGKAKVSSQTPPEVLPLETVT